MRRANRQRTRIERVALGAALGLLVACTTTIRQHPAFPSRIGEISDIGIMPPDVSVMRIVFKGDNEPLPDEEQAVAADLPHLLARYVRDRDFTVRMVPLDDELFLAFPELRFEASQSQRAFTSAMAEMYKTVEMSESHAMSYERSLGPEVTQFAELAGVDALLFSKYSGFKKSQGELVKNALVAIIVGGGFVADGSTLQVSLVDGSTGDLLWSNTVGLADQGANFAVARSGLSPLEFLAKKAFEEFTR